MTRRPAVTLIEALMAIFVMAIGLLALLTLFPLGAVQMAQALKDERTAQSGLTAIAMFKGFDLGNDPFVNSPNFENPGQGLPVMTTGVNTSYPVFVDPVGFANGAAVPVGNTFAVAGIPAIPRVSVSRLPQQSALQPNALPGQTTAWANRWFSMPDDHTYADNGVPDLAGFGNPVPTPAPPNYSGQNTLGREGRYTWAYMVRRQTAMVPSPPPSPGAPPVPPINLAVVVFSGRSPGADFAGNPLGETLFSKVTYGPAPDNSPNVVRIDWTGQTRPTLRRGSWVLDARMLPVPSQPPGTQLPGVATFFNVPQGYFYRVVSVNDVAATVIDVEVQRPLGGPMRGPYGPAGGGAYYTGPLIAVDNISEVFDKDTNY